MSEKHTYRYRLKLEQDRARSHRVSRQGAFEASMLSLDDPSMRRTEDEDSPAWESDGGKGADALCASVDSETEEHGLGDWQAKIARKRLGRKSKRLLQVFDLLVSTRKPDDGDCRNGETPDPKESVIRGLMSGNRMSRKVAQTVFLREMKKLEKIFLGNKNGGLVSVSDR